MRATSPSARARRRRRGYFISFEGGEGAGKSTQIRHLCAWLKEQGLPLVLTLEPGGTPIGQKIREVLLNPDLGKLSSRAELLLYQADRAHHVDELVLPALEAGKIVVTDRYTDSSLVYQGLCRGLGVKWVDTLNRYATGGTFPDLVFVLDIPEKEGFARVHKRRGKLTRLELEKQSFHKKVRRGFLSLARKTPSRYAVIDARDTEESVREAILGVLQERLRRRGLWQSK